MKPAAFTYPTTGPDAARLPDGSPRPVDPGTGKPLMSELEASWHGHVSGMAAKADAERRGDRGATAALLDGAVAGQEVIAGFALQPLSVGIFELLSMIRSPHASEQGGSVNLMDLARTVLIFAHPEHSWICLREGGDRTAFEAEARRVAFRLTAPVLRQVNAFIEREMSEFFSAEATEKKPPSPVTNPAPTPMPSPASPVPAPAPPAAGCPP